MNKKLAILIASSAGLATLAYILYNSLDKLNELDLNDPFEVDIDDE